MLNKKGFTLSELLTATALGGIVLLILMAIFQIVNQRFMATRERLAAEDLAAQAEYLLKLVFSQALDLQLVGAPLPGVIGGSGQMIGPVHYTTIAAGPAAWTAMAVFNRESQAMFAAPAGTMNPANGKPKQTAIWYIGPTAVTEGMLILDTSSNGLGNWAGAVAPTLADPFIDRISTFEMVPTVHPTFINQVVSIDFHLTIRYNDNPSNPNGINWCPKADIPVTAGCTLPTPWRDVDRAFRVITRNNILHGASGAFVAGSSVTSEERVLGNLYFFNAMLPTQ